MNIMDDLPELLRRLEFRTNKTDTCWLWQGARSSGYGVIRLGKPGPKHYVHRLSAYIHLNYDLTSNLQVNHKPICKNRNCWNPEHIYAGTQWENMQDTPKIGSQNSGVTHCKYGHEFTPENTYIWNGERHCRTCRSYWSKENA